MIKMIQDVTVNLMESGDCVIHHNPPGLVLLLEGKRTDLVVLQHNRCRLTVIPAIIESTLVSDGHDCKSFGIFTFLELISFKVWGKMFDTPNRQNWTQ